MMKINKGVLRHVIEAVINEEAGAPASSLDPNDDGNLTPMDLFRHFDLDSDGQVSVKDYEDHVKWHCKNPDGVQQELSIEQTVPMHLQDSGIHGTGVFATDNIPAGTNLGISHITAGDSYIPTNLGAFHNHSDEPNAGNVLRRGLRRLFALQDIAVGDEITVDYRQQPDLEQPDSF
jgi:hypothetical protein